MIKHVATYNTHFLKYHSYKKKWNCYLLLILTVKYNYTYIIIYLLIFTNLSYHRHTADHHYQNSRHCYIYYYHCLLSYIDSNQVDTGNTLIFRLLTQHQYVVPTGLPVCIRMLKCQIIKFYKVNNHDYL